MTKQIGIIIGVLAVLLIGGVAWAQGAGRQGGRQGGQERQGGEGERQRPAFGTIISISADEIVIKPELPPELEGRMQERGRELPELPDQISLKLSADTKFVVENGMGSISDFQAGDYVVVMPDRDGNARTVADKESAQDFIKQRMEKRRGGEGGGEGRGFGGPGGQGEGPGGPDGERRPPAMGSITAISSTSITIKPMIPEEMKQRMQENGRELPELPESLTWAIDADTHYVTRDGQVDGNPFKVGDVVVVLGPPEDGSARAILAEGVAREKMQGRRGEGGGKGKGKGGEGKQKRRQKQNGND